MVALWCLSCLGQCFVWHDALCTSTLSAWLCHSCLCGAAATNGGLSPPLLWLAIRTIPVAQTWSLQVSLCRPCLWCRPVARAPDSNFRRIGFRKHQSPCLSALCVMLRVAPSGLWVGMNSGCGVLPSRLSQTWNPQSNGHQLFVVVFDRQCNGVKGYSSHPGCAA